MVCCTLISLLKHSWTLWMSWRCLTMVTNKEWYEKSLDSWPGCVLDIETLCWEFNGRTHLMVTKLENWKEVTKYDRVCTRNTCTIQNTNTVHVYMNTYSICMHKLMCVDMVLTLLTNFCLSTSTTRAWNNRKNTINTLTHTHSVMCVYTYTQLFLYSPQSTVFMYFLYTNTQDISRQWRTQYIQHTHTHTNTAHMYRQTHTHTHTHTYKHTHGTHHRIDCRQTLTSSISISRVSSCFTMGGLIPIMNGTGEQQKSMRLLGRTGMNVCWIENRERKHKIQKDISQVWDVFLPYLPFKWIQ